MKSILHYPGAGQAEFVVLFDIDGTLIRGPSGRRSAGFLAMHEALSRISGQGVRMTDLDFSGQTDRLIARMLLRSAGELSPSEKAIDLLLNYYLDHLEILVDDIPYEQMGDPFAAVEALRSLGAVIGIGTGNLQQGARIKLQNAGLLDLFDLQLGGFADDGEDRKQIIAAAAKRCDPSRALPMIVIGDTPRDIEAAHACDAWCIAVPFAGNTEAVLKSAGADMVVDRLDCGISDIVASLLGICAQKGFRAASTKPVRSPHSQMP